jgi:Fe-S oxidoreductase
LAGTSPSLVKKLRGRLEQKLSEKVGIVLDCCSDPVYQMGDEDRVVEACRHIRERLIRGKITRIITGCPNCRKIFTTYFPEMRIDFALDLLLDDLVLDNLPQMVFLHHPCPVMKFETSRRNIEDWIGQHRSMDGQSSLVACCGNGGRLPALSKDLSDRFTRKITAQAKDRPILTYCTGCNHRFHAEGKTVYHLLGCLPGTAPAMRHVSMRRRWWNRFFLSMEQHIKSGKENKRGAV